MDPQQRHYGIKHVAVLVGASLILLIAAFLTLRSTPDCLRVQLPASQGAVDAEGYLIQYSRVAEGSKDVSSDC
jgi:hypothetical protein